MAHSYVNALAQYTAVFPGSVYTPRELRHPAANGFPVSGEAFTVPASADGEGRRRMLLDYLPMEVPGFTITVGGSSRTIIPYGETPASGEVAVSFAYGIVEFHASDAGGSASASYTARGTGPVVALLIAIQKELAATQTLAAGRVTGPVSSTVGRVAVWNDTTGDTLKEVPVTINDSGDVIAATLRATGQAGTGNAPVNVGADGTQFRGAYDDLDSITSRGATTTTAITADIGGNAGETQTLSTVVARNALNEARFRQWHISGQVPSGVEASTWTLTLPHGSGTFIVAAAAMFSISTAGAISFAAQAANAVLAGPTSGGSATPTFRGLVAADIPWASPGAIGATTPAAGTFSALAATSSKWQWATVCPAAHVAAGWGGLTPDFDGAQIAATGAPQPVYFPPMVPGTKVRKIRVVISGTDDSGVDGLDFRLFYKVSEHNGAAGWTPIGTLQSLRITDFDTRALEYTLPSEHTVLDGADYMILGTSVLVSSGHVAWYAASLEINPAT